MVDAKKQEKTPEVENNDCFVIMPIADHPDYSQGHFDRVYESIVKPACETAGVNPIRADEVVATNIIHADILSKIVRSKIAICDLSSRNPNVFFELGIRQAFDLPVVVLKDKATADVFDVNLIRYIPYSKELRYDEVLKVQDRLAQAISATLENNQAEEGVNSIIKMLSLTEAASIPNSENSASDAKYHLLDKKIDALQLGLERLASNASFLSSSFDAPTSSGKSVSPKRNFPGKAGKFAAERELYMQELVLKNDMLEREVSRLIKMVEADPSNKDLAKQLEAKCIEMRVLQDRIEGEE